MKNIKFENAISRLEEIVDELAGEIDDLDKVVSLFQEGYKLVKYCHEKLDNVENKIKILSDKIESGEVEE